MTDEEVRGWVNVDTFSFWCLRCAPDVRAVRVLHGLKEDDDRLPIAPAGEAWANRQPLHCERCGRRL